jgi:hypothetical protein
MANPWATIIDKHFEVNLKFREFYDQGIIPLQALKDHRDLLVEAIDAFIDFEEKRTK